MAPRHLGRLPISLILLAVLAAPAHPADTIRIGNTHTLLTALILIAEHQHFFEHEGVDVEVVPLSTGGDGLAGINDGSLQLYTASDVTFIKHFHKNPDLRVLSTLGEWGNETRVLVRQDSGIRSADELRGRKIGVHKGLAFHWFFDLLLRRHGMTEEDVEIQFLHLAKQPQALANGEIDAFVSREPFFSKANELMPDNTLLIEAPGLMVKRFILIAHKDYLARHGDKAESILRALLHAERLTRRDPQRTKAILKEILKDKHTSIDAHLNEIRMNLSLDDHLLYTLEKVARWWQLIERYDPLWDINFLNVIVPAPLRQAKPHGVLMHQ